MIRGARTQRAEEITMSQAADKAVDQHLVTGEAVAEPIAAVPTCEEHQPLASAADDIIPDDIGALRSPPGIVELTDDELARVVGGMCAFV
jgi:hypothetical protein